MVKFLSLLALVWVCTLLSPSLQQNNAPVIGIYAQPSDMNQYPPDQYQYISASYVKHIEMAGARVVPIFYDSSRETLDLMFSQINGLLFTGGGLTLQKGDLYSDNAAYLFNKAILANMQGDYFPIWGTCMGFQLLHIIVADFASESEILTYVKDLNVVHKLEVSKVGRHFSKMPKKLFSAVTTSDVYFYSHNWGIIDETYAKYQNLRNFFDITSYSYTNAGVKFIASVESKLYPIYGSQYHAEKLFEWKVNANRTAVASQAEQYTMNFFISECRKSMHSFSQISLDDYNIQTYPCIQSDPSESSNQFYVFPNSI